MQFMKSLSDNLISRKLISRKLISLAVILVLAVAPLQGAFASMADCGMVTGTATQQHTMNKSQQNKNKAQHVATPQIHCYDHDCNQDQCTVDHCTAAATVMSPFNNNSDVFHNTADYSLNNDSSLTSILFFSLFRPPKA